MSFTAFILFGHLCLAVPGDLDQCSNIYENPPIRYSSERICMKAAKDYLHGAQLYYKRQKRSISEIELHCIGVDPIEPV